MEYMIFYLTGYKEIDTTELNQLAKDGWRVVCPYKDYGLVLEKRMEVLVDENYRLSVE